MGTPEYDSEGFPLPYDDSEIKNSHTLIRYIDFLRWYDPLKKELASSAFSTSSKQKGGQNPGMSTDWKESMIASGVGCFSRAKSTEIVAELNVGYLRELASGVKVGQTPDRANDNPHHSDVWGVKNHNRKMRDRATYHYLSIKNPLED